jgi:hypothetical protein
MPDAAMIESDSAILTSRCINVPLRKGQVGIGEGPAPKRSQGFTKKGSH